MLMREQHAFPDLPLITLTVTDEEIGAAVLAVHFLCQRHTDGTGHALPQRTGGHVNARRQVAVAVAGQFGAGLIQRIQHIHGKESLECQRSVDRKSVV